MFCHRLPQKSTGASTLLVAHRSISWPRRMQEGDCRVQEYIAAVDTTGLKSANVPRESRFFGDRASNLAIHSTSVLHSFSESSPKRRVHKQVVAFDSVWSPAQPPLRRPERSFVGQLANHHVPPELPHSAHRSTHLPRLVRLPLQLLWTMSSPVQHMYTSHRWRSPPKDSSPLKGPISSLSESEGKIRRV